MSYKAAHYLQEHLTGEVLTSVDARRYFSTDGSVFSVVPSLIVYPQDENDVRKTARFTWQLAERGRVIPVTARGSGTDQSGAAIGSGIIMVFPAHMKRLVELDSKNNTVVVEPGMNYGKIQQTLHTHGRFLPPFPASMDYSTVGGAIANNSGGEKSVKYGTTKDYVKELRVVLANGEIIETRRLSKREFSKKMGLISYEGEIYRALDTLIEENQEVLSRARPNVSKNSAGYNIWDVKRRDGSFDLTPLLVGSQGTLGIVTEISLKTVSYNPNTTLIAAFCDDLRIAEDIVQELHKLPEKPASIELVDENLLNFIDTTNPNQLKGLVDKPFPKLVLLVEFDNPTDRVQKKFVKSAQKILDGYEVTYKIETDEQKKEELWKIRRSTATVLAHNDGNVKALPIIEDGIVPIDKLQEYLDGVYALLKRHHLSSAIWGHAGDANLHIQPFLDLSQVGDRQKVFRLMDEYYDLVIGLGGSTSAEHNDGRLRGAYLTKLYGEEMYNLFEKIKHVFDPYGILNPGVKVGVSLEEIKQLLRSEFSGQYHYEHLPHG